MLYSCSDDCTVKLWNWKDGNLLSNHPIVAMNSAIVNMSFHQESNMNISKINIASADGNIAIYDIHSDKIIYDYQFSTQLTNILSNNSTIILPSNTGKISIYNIPNIQGVTNSINQKESIEDYRISCRQVFKKMFDVFKNIYLEFIR